MLKLKSILKSIMAFFAFFVLLYLLVAVISFLVWTSTEVFTFVWELLEKFV